MKENITAFEGTLHKLTVNVSGVEDFSDYLVYGAAQPYGCSKCAHFEVVTKTEGTCEMIIPALSCGIYKYQLFIKRISTNQEFLILEGEINVKDRLCDCSAVTSNDETATVVDATFSADTVEVNVSIQEGAEGKPGPQGPQGEPGENGISEEEIQTALEPYATKEYVDEKIATSGPSEVLTDADKKRMVETYYGVNLDLYNTWVIYNEFGGISATNRPELISSYAASDIEEWDAKGEVLYSYDLDYNANKAQEFLGKRLVNFNYNLGSGRGQYNDLYYQSISLPNAPFATTLRVEGGEDNVFDISSYDDINNFKASNNSLESIKVITRPGQLQLGVYTFYNCENLKNIDADFSGLVYASDTFYNCGIEEFEGDLQYLESASGMFVKSKIKNVRLTAPLLTSPGNMFAETKNLESVEIDFPSVTNASYMFQGSGPIKHLVLNLDNVTNASYMFQNSEIKEFNETLPKCTEAYSMFNGSGLEKYDGNLPEVVNINSMFSSSKRLKNLAATFPKATSAYNLCNYCDKLETVSLSLPEVTNFSYAFESCPMLKDVYLDLDKLQSVSDLFGNVWNSTKNLESVTLNVPLLKSVSNMFEGKKKLTSFKGDLSSLTSGYAMFSGCNKLTSFDAELPSLSTADSMFSGCNLDAESCVKIFGSLPKYTSGSHKMDIRVQVSAVDTIEEVLGLRKGEIDKTATNWRAYIAKGWTFYISISND